MTTEEQPKITLRSSPEEHHIIGEDLLCTYLPRERIIRLSLLDGTRAVSLTLDQAMELSVILDLWTQDSGASKRRNAPRRTQAS